MRRLLILTMVLALGAAGTPGLAQSDGIYARMQRVNANLRSYQASVHVDVTMHGLLPLNPSLDGMAYFEQPDKTAVVFQTVPALASQFKKIYPQLEPPSTWPRLYDVTVVSDDGTNAHLRLVRKVNGRIDHVDVTADDKTATVTTMAYFYKDGGSVSFQQSYDVIDGNYVVRAQTGKVEIPFYNADVSSTFSNYKLNVKIDQGVFATD
jgi:hypothetical protein